MTELHEAENVMQTRVTIQTTNASYKFHSKNFYTKANFNVLLLINSLLCHVELKVFALITISGDCENERKRIFSFLFTFHPLPSSSCGQSYERWIEKEKRIA